MNLNVDIDINEEEVLSEQNKALILDNCKNKYMVYSFFKRILDIIGSLVGIVLLLPISAIVYILRILKKENEGPMFYDQLRIGKGGKEFKLYKYRTMVMHADEKLFKYLDENPEAKKEYLRYKKLKDDPRITHVGNFLRKTSLDEFPQFINILKGDMSLVGPRPYLHREQKDMGEKYYKIISCKPGLTGYWQVNGRSDVDFEERLSMDCNYIENRSLWLDIKIIFKTIGKIFKKDGAI